MSIFLRTIPAAILLLHLGFYIFFSAKGKIPPFELFNMMLLAANFIIFFMFLRRKVSDVAVGLSVMFLIGSHAFIGQFLAPDSLTS